MTSSDERAKVLSVRLSYDEYEQLNAQAVEVGVGPSTLARTLIRRGLGTGSPTVDFVHGTTADLVLEPANERGLAARVAALEDWVARQDH